MGEPSERFLRLTRVGLDLGDRFGAGGVDHVRLNFATSAAIVDQATATHGTGALRLISFARTSLSSLSFSPNSGHAGHGWFDARRSSAPSVWSEAQQTLARRAKRATRVLVRPRAEASANR